MADNIAITAGSGTTIATDDVGSVHYQRVKLAVGGADAAGYGATPYHQVNDASANQDATVVKASAGIVYGWDLSNADTEDLYVKLYDNAAGPTSASTPIRVWLVPAGSGWSASRVGGIACATGISFRITKGIADNNATAADTGTCIVGIDYV